MRGVRKGADYIADMLENAQKARKFVGEMESFYARRWGNAALSPLETRGSRLLLLIPLRLSLR